VVGAPDLTMPSGWFRLVCQTALVRSHAHQDCPAVGPRAIRPFTLVTESSRFPRRAGSDAASGDPLCGTGTVVLASAVSREARVGLHRTLSVCLCSRAILVVRFIAPPPNCWAQYVDPCPVG